MELYVHSKYFKNNYTQITITSKTVYEPWHSCQMTQTKLKLVKIKFKKQIKNFFLAKFRNDQKAIINIGCQPEIHSCSQRNANQRHRVLAQRLLSRQLCRCM